MRLKLLTLILPAIALAIAVPARSQEKAAKADPQAVLAAALKDEQKAPPTLLALKTFIKVAGS